MPASNVPQRRFARALLSLITALLVWDANAAAPQVRRQAPGYYRMMVGSFEITALSDGTRQIPYDQLMRNITPERLEELTDLAHLREPIENSSAAYLINTGSRLILVDGGAGVMWGDTLGRVMTNLKAAGYQPGDVDAVLVTHLHFDHVGGLLDGDKMAFPNAMLWVSKDEADFWLSPSLRAKASPANKPVFDDALKAVAPYKAAGHLKTFTGDATFAPGVTALPTHGHTAGSTSYVVQDGGAKLVIWGDIIHLSAVQFAEPSATIAFDSDEQAAFAKRRAAFAEAAKEGYWTASSHAPFPGIGHVNNEGDHYRYVPATYVTIFPPATP